MEGEIEWCVDIFCIHFDTLIPADNNKYNFFETIDHYFINCDCYKMVGTVYNSNCIYKKSYPEISDEEYWNKVSIEELKERLEKENKNKEEIEKLIKKIEKDMTREYLYPEEN